MANFFSVFLLFKSPIEFRKMGSSPVYKLEEDSHDYESGYASGSSSNAEFPEIYFTKPHLAFLNRQFQNLEPQGTKFASLLVHGQADI